VTLFEGAGEARYQKLRDELRQKFAMIDAIARERYHAEQAERDGTIESADAHMAAQLDEAADEALSKAKMEHHAYLLSLGIDDPEAHHDFEAGLFGGFRKDEPKEK